MQLRVTLTSIPDVVIIEPEVFEDERGFFFESFNQNDFNLAIGQEITFVQDNHSKSKKGILRGLHYQTKQTQGKLVRVAKGSVYDVAVDLRQSSKTFGQWVGIELSASNKKQLWIPKGFAHGFLVMSNEAEFLYKTTDYYHPDSEHTLLWSDNVVGIQWPVLDGEVSVSQKDLNGAVWSDAPKFI